MKKQCCRNTNTYPKLREKAFMKSDSGKLGSAVVSAAVGAE